MPVKHRFLVLIVTTLCLILGGLIYKQQLRHPTPATPSPSDTSPIQAPDSQSTSPAEPQNSGSSQPNSDQNIVAGTSLVKITDPVSKSAFLAANNLSDADLQPVPYLPNTYEVARSADSLVAAGTTISPERIYRALLTPNDPTYPQWFTDKISAPTAWDVTTGSNSVRIAVIDTGFAMNHEDLSSQWAINSGESGGGKETNGIDDDSNGSIDDWRGWDFVTNDNDPSTTSIGHATQVAGLAGAAGNNTKGIASVDWGARILPLRVLNNSGSGTTADVASAVAYARIMGVKVINLSLGSPDSDPVLEAEINNATAAGISVVAAAGNCGDPSFFLNNCNSQGQIIYPANYSGVVAVGASDINDNRASFSSFGANLDLMAPGTGSLITPTISGGNSTTAYTTSADGTSFAAPIVSGAVALLDSVYSNLSPTTIEALLHKSVDKVAGMNGANRTDDYGYGRLNAYKLVSLSGDTCPDKIVANSNLGGVPSGGRVLTQNYPNQNDRFLLTFTNQTGTSCVEVHTWAAGQQSWISNISTNHPAASPTNVKIIAADTNGDGQDELIFVKLANTGSGRIEVHTWNQNQQSWLSNIASNHPVVNPADVDVIAGDVNGDGRDELLLVMYRNTGSGRVEIHEWNAGQQSWAAHTATSLPAIDPADDRVVAANLYGSAADELVFVKYRNTGSGRIEVHTWAGGQQSWLSNVATNHGMVNPDDAEVMAGNIYGGAIDELVFVKYKNTGSSKIEIHTWAAGQQTWLSNVATNHPTL